MPPGMRGKGRRNPAAVVTAGPVPPPRPMLPPPLVPIRRRGACRSFTARARSFACCTRTFWRASWNAIGGKATPDTPCATPLPPPPPPTPRLSMGGNGMAFRSLAMRIVDSRGGGCVNERSARVRTASLTSSASIIGLSAWSL